MTANQLSYSFDVNFDSIANFSSPGFENSEKSEFLTQAQENIYLDLIAPQIDQRSSATQNELNKIIIAELIRNSGDLTPLPTNKGNISDELLSSTGWTSVGWTGSYPTFTHTVANTTVLSNTLAAAVSTYYKIEYTITGRTAGTLVIAFGGQSITVLSTGVFQTTAATTGNLTITPTTDFNGAITISIKSVSSSVTLTNLPYGQFVYLPTDFFFPLTELADIIFTSGYYYDYGSPTFPKRIRTGLYVRPMNQLDYNLSVDSHIRKPNEDVVWRLEYGRETSTSPISATNKKIYELIGDGTYNITAYKATYYRRLLAIDIDSDTTSELDPFIHRTIVKDAIRLAAAAINDPNKYQMSAMNLKDSTI